MSVDELQLLEAFGRFLKITVNWKMQK